MSCEKSRSNEHHTFRREYSREAKEMGRAMYNMLLNGPLDKSRAILTVQETRDACSYCRSLAEKAIREFVFSCISYDVPDDAEDVVHEPTLDKGGIEFAETLRKLNSCREDD